MEVVKIRRVGNSNVISLPRSLERLGYTSGTSVVVEELESGELRVIPASKVSELIREMGRRVVAENREALDILEKRGGYGAGDKLVSELKPPPRGPAPGSRRPAQNDDRKK